MSSVGSSFLLTLSVSLTNVLESHLPQNVKNQNPKHLFFNLVVLFCCFSGFFNPFTICNKYRTRLSCNNRVSQVALVVKNPLAKAGDVRDVGSIPGPLKEGMATHSNVLTRRILWAEEPDRLQSMELQRAGRD